MEQIIKKYRIPIKYKSAPGSSVAAYVPFYTGDDRVGVYDKEYAYGWYDAEKDEVHLNPNYHGDLDDEKDVAYLEREKARIDEIVNKTKEQQLRQRVKIGIFDAFMLKQKKFFRGGFFISAKRKELEDGRKGYTGFWFHHSR